MILFGPFQFLVPYVAIDVIIHLGRLRDRSRKLLEICEVTGMENGQITTAPLFRFHEQDEKDAEVQDEAREPAEDFELGLDLDRGFIRHGRRRSLFCGGGRNT